MDLLEFNTKMTSAVGSIFRLFSLLLIFVGPVVLGIIIRIRKRNSVDELAERIFNSKEDDVNFNPNMMKAQMISRRPFDYRWFVMPNRSVEIRKIIQKTDKNFYPIPLMDQAKDLFIRLQNCWVEGNTGNVANDLHPEYLAKMNDMIAQSYNPLIVMHIEDITFHNFYLTFYKGDMKNVYVTIYLESQMIRYAEEAATGDIVSGSITEREESVNLMKFTRPAFATSEDSRWLLYDFTLSVIGTVDEKIVIED